MTIKKRQSKIKALFHHRIQQVAKPEIICRLKNYFDAKIILNVRRNGSAAPHSN
jgi:hypothetical protein